MSNKVKLKVRRGKAKIKLKSGHEPLPVNGPELTALLGAAVTAAVGTPAEADGPPQPELQVGSTPGRLLAAPAGSASPEE